ncbi:hypothetical protein NQ318_001981 [Aromia moschata]|uniref:C2H2-type domain-containing protein n=1 Tax=Aromia moschata TaxID=1265417 RepID=A0AAV8Z255_9CUCU|nr:hypothetical protein NQ318_001981 [Aromia moschata]
MQNETEQYSNKEDNKIFIKTEIKEEYDADSYTNSLPETSSLGTEHFITETKHLKDETENTDIPDQKYFISKKDLEQIGALTSEEIKVEPFEAVPTPNNNTEEEDNRKLAEKICPYCNLHFPTSKNFKRHVMNHTDERPFQCNLCDSKFKGKYHLTIHIKTHTGERNIPCPVCDKSFIVRSALKAHMRTHSKEKPYVCHICGRGFSHQANLKPHVATHSDGLPFECEHCGERVRDRKGLLKHLRYHHMDCKDEECQFCLKFNKDPQKTSKELQKRMWNCPYCPESFKYYPTYKNHVKTHNNESFACTLSYLRIHMRNHTGETPFQCNDCGKKFKRKDSLRYHLGTHKEERKLFHCDLCNQGYTHRSSLFKHKRDIHSVTVDRTTTSCKICEEKLEDKAFRLHMKKHGVQVFKCRKCKEYIEGEEVFEAHKKIEMYSASTPGRELYGDDGNRRGNVRRTKFEYCGGE